MTDGTDAVSLKSLFLQQSDRIEKQFQLLDERFETRLTELETRLDVRLQAVTTAIADLRVQFAEYQVLAVRVEGLEATAERIEKRHGDDIQVLLRQIRDLSDEIAETAISLSESQARYAEYRTLCDANTVAIGNLRVSGSRKFLQIVIAATIVTAILVSGIVTLVVVFIVR